ncbi:MULTISPECIES: inorganic phosphate transporter [Novosphingobium]|uniref:inorganic phosphate transporter n=1 Tax=Novosphingobium TaxID=165696 RepID=UPI0007878B6F|nr:MULTISPECIES: inorganic phosphate transporter [Novosphingobium]PTR10392.1 PiT family inorganic phosphate transporter [Novosphingobium sp. GV055]PUB03063.1 PiT family inorganic phosphate transporter [Novosphingobium sp. GV061]PUB19724.1 PiT family inorganic phosphate transporter [Novosphingobium sp. GV079]PUB41363.1 PiT family inorganic phosphate transporter [Novosphingobium sp. GV027]WQD94141.1 inorganic phosphate transporter [Novosphingobium capsulatum]
MNHVAVALPLIIALVIMALAFDFINGLHDAANSIATVVSTRLLTPVQAVLFAAFFNFAAYFTFGLKVAETVGKGIIDKDVITPQVIFGALVGAMTWNVITWWRGIPSSSSHALIGGLLGAGTMHAGTSAIVWKGVTSTTSAIVLSPVVGLVVSMVLMLLSSWLFAKASARTAESSFKKLHLISAAAYSIGHGANDAQKTMGIIAVLLYSQGMLGGTFHVPGWVVISCYIAMGLGTLSGGWKIIETMGSRITKLSHHQGFCASAGGSIMLFAASAFGIPVSTTHTITGCVVGVGAARRASAVRWSVAQRVVVAWLVTIPASALVGAIFYEIAKVF